MLAFASYSYMAAVSKRENMASRVGYYGFSLVAACYGSFGCLPRLW